jgi:hypothetical protein
MLRFTSFEELTPVPLDHILPIHRSKYEGHFCFLLCYTTSHQFLHVQLLHDDLEVTLPSQQFTVLPTVQMLFPPRNRHRCSMAAASVAMAARWQILLSQVLHNAFMQQLRPEVLLPAVPPQLR